VQQLREQLQRYGLAGLLAYGLLNTAYYSCTFLFVWVYVAKVPHGLGLQGAALKFLEVFALTWGGSQVINREGGLTHVPILMEQRAGLRVAGLSCRRPDLRKRGAGWGHSSRSLAASQHVTPAVVATYALYYKSWYTICYRWICPQVTKVARAAGALALAPLVDRLLDGARGALQLQSKRQAFGVVVCGCVALALLLFAAVVSAYA
jgi:hypothetical protein